MIQKLLYGEKKVPKSIENQKEFTVEYYLVTSEFEQKTTPLKTYGIEIVKYFKNQKVESKLLKDIDISKEKVRSILYMLYKNIVTPVTFLDVVENLLAYEFEPVSERKGA